MIFKRRTTDSINLDSPQAMLRDLSKKTIPGILDYQSAVLTEYQTTALEAPNVAIELPTGGGKSLVGILLAEWRRRTRQERCIYLCPTVQLANQTAEYAQNKYGIDVALLTGKQKLYPTVPRNAYQDGSAVAVTTYSALFNTNPFFNDGQVLVFDDAHASETYIAGLWTIDIDRIEHQEAFEALAAVIEPFLSPAAKAAFRGEEDQAWDRAWVELLPFQRWHERTVEIIGVLDAHAAESSLVYAWRMVKQHLSACQIYLGPGNVGIRPVVPPTQSFSPLVKANQRIFMSATLGESGDLERITGIDSFIRIKGSEQTLKLGVGRRFFIFPGRAQDESDVVEIEKSLIRTTNRALVLLPSNRMAEREREALADLDGYELLSIKDLEESKVAFLEAPAAIAVLAGRYDGLDFPDTDCRLLIIRGLPGALELQERYLRNKAAAGEFLQMRVRNRVVQAVGRCTRNENDYSAVVVLEDELLKYFQQRESRELLPQELQAEILFGLDQSANENEEFMRTQMLVFLEHGAEWQAAEAVIRSWRSETNAGVVPYSKELGAAAAFEVRWQNAMWSGAFKHAFEEARAVLDRLEHPKLRGYRAFWNYLAGVAALLAGEKGTDVGSQSAAQFREAGKVIPDLDVMSRQPASSSVEFEEELRRSAIQKQVEAIESKLSALGVSSNTKYERYDRDIRQGINASESTSFEPALVNLGLLLGFHSGKVEEDASPDPWWVIDDNNVIVFEAHSDGVTGTLGANKARQASGHVKWVQQKLGMNSPSVFPVLLSNASPATEGAEIQLEGVSLWGLDEFRKWSVNALGVVRDLRREYSGRGHIIWRSNATDLLKANELDCASLLRKVQSLVWKN